MMHGWVLHAHKTPAVIVRNCRRLRPERISVQSAHSLRAVCRKNKLCMASTGKQCKATKVDGTPCTCAPIRDSEYCFHHDPARAKERVEARRRGGSARHGRLIGKISETKAAAVTAGLSKEKIKVPLETIEDVRKLLEITATSLMELEKSVARERALISLASVAVEVIKVGGIEERLAAIEERLSSA